MSRTEGATVLVARDARQFLQDETAPRPLNEGFPPSADLFSF